MKNKEKIYIGILVVIAIVVILFAVTKNKDKEDNAIPPVNNQTQNVGEFEKDLGNGVSVNTSNKLSDPKTFEGFEISDIQLSKSGNTSELLATVKNTTNTKTQMKILKIKLVDKENNEIKTVTCAVKELEPGESTQISSSASFNYVNAYDFIATK